MSTLEQFGDMETLSVEEVVGSLRTHEERLKVCGKGSSSSDGQLLLTEEEWARRENTEGKLLLLREDWLKRSNRRNTEGNTPNFRCRIPRDNSNLKCYNCGIYGHFAVDCRRPKRNRELKEEANMAKLEDDEPALLLAKCDTKRGETGTPYLCENQTNPSQMLKSQGESNVWYLDNGASSHMTGFEAKFTRLDKQVTGVVSFGDGSEVKIQGKGSVSFVCKNGEIRELKDVYYIPTLRNNIISLGQLTEEGNRIAIKGELLWIYDSCNTLLMKVKRSQNRLYKMIINNVQPTCLLAKKVELESKLWHSRMGHVNYHALALMSKGNMASGLPKIILPEEVCRGCLMSKQTRKQFPTKSNYAATKVLELVHGDLCGLISPETASGKKYFFLLVDDYS